MPPNILLIVFDTARADAFEPYGAPAGSTPAVADLARRGAALKGVFSTANWTVPAHASMFTGLLPLSMGLGSAHTRRAMEGHKDRVLAEVLRRAGYRTAGVSANVWVTRRMGFDIGFEEFRPVTGQRRHRPRKGMRGRIRWDLDAVRASIDDGLAAVDETVRSWISQRTSTPFFWFVNLMECHSPYLPPRPWNDLSPIGRYRAGSDARRYQSQQGFFEVCLGKRDVPDASIARMRHLYARSVASMDDWLGRLLGEFERAGMLDDTLVIATSDHGENLGEGHLLGHAFSLDDRLIRVPFVAAGPGAPADGTLRSLMDVPSLMASAAGITDVPWPEFPVEREVAIAQTSLYDMLPRKAAENLIKALDIHDDDVLRMFEVSLSAATDGRFKLAREGEVERLFDLANDPLETSDASPANPDQVARLRAFLDAADAGPPGAGPRVTVPPVVEAATPGEAEDIEERMRLLGYL